MNTRLDSEILDQLLARLERSVRPPSTQLPEHILPVHTLRVAADRFHNDSVPRAGARALRLLQTYAPDCVVLAQALRLPGYEALPTDPVRVDALLSRVEAGEAVHPAAMLAHEVYRRVHRQLTHLPVQDLRIDFHSALGRRADDEEDAVAAAAATEFAITLRNGMPCPRVGVRIKPLSGPEAARALRTLDIFVSTLLDRGPGFPENLVLSLPQVTHHDQITVAVQAAGTLEARLGLVRGTLRLEIGIADPSTIIDESGALQIGALVGAAAGRCAGVRLDPVELARALGARDPSVAEPLRDLVRAALGTVTLSYGSSPDLPHGGGRRMDSGERFAAVHAAWRAHADAVLRALRHGVGWGWDHDAGQIPARLAAVAVHYRQTLPALRAEISELLSGASWADSPARFAAGQRVLDDLLTGLDAGALSPEDLGGLGLDGEVLASRSFRVAVERRTG